MSDSTWKWDDEKNPQTQQQANQWNKQPLPNLRTPITTANNTINTTSQPYDTTENIYSVITKINALSTDQLRIRQNRNVDSTFAPQTIMPRYFKTFNGDNYSMIK